MKKLAILTLVFSFIFAGTVSATAFRDVPANHFAIDAIRWVSAPANGSFMVGDASGNFNPARVMDSFETAITLAMAAGFRYSPASITPAEQAVFDQAHARHSALLANMAQTHPNWRRAADREIAFLLELGILTQYDLANFMTRGPGGTEVPAQLTKEAASAFVMRLAGKQDKVNDFPLPPEDPFTDDAQISAMYRRYAYSAHRLGVVTDYDGYFSPRRTVTRAEFAQMCYFLLVTSPDDLPTAAAASPFYRTFHGTVHEVGADQIEIATATGRETYEFGENAIIVVDNQRRDASYITTGMLIAVGLNSDEQIISLLARSEGPEAAITATTVELVTSGEGPRMLQPQIRISPPELIPQAIPAINVVWFRGEGIVADVGTEQAQPSLTVRTSRVRLLTGEIVNEETRFAVTPQTNILRGEQAVALPEIQRGEIITFYYSTYAANVIHAIHLQENNRNILGSLVGRHFTGEAPKLIVEDREGDQHEFYVNADTSIARNTNTAAWLDLRIGDEVAAQVEAGQLVGIQATGRRSSGQGTLEEIHITQNLDTILIRRTDGLTVRLALPPEIYDIYSLRLGMELQLSLDSREIDQLIVMNAVQESEETTGFIGYVQSLRHGHTMVVTDAESTRRTVRIDGNTINTATGEALVFRDLRTQMRLYIVQQEDSRTAQSITILP